MFGPDQSALMECDHKFTHVGRFKSSEPYDTFGPIWTYVQLVIKYHINLSSKNS